MSPESDKDPRLADAADVTPPSRTSRTLGKTPPGRFPSAEWAVPKIKRPVADALVDDDDPLEEASAPGSGGLTEFYRLVEKITEMGAQDPEADAALHEVLAQVARKTAARHAAQHSASMWRSRPGRGRPAVAAS